MFKEHGCHGFGSKEPIEDLIAVQEQVMFIPNKVLTWWTEPKKCINKWEYKLLCVRYSYKPGYINPLSLGFHSRLNLKFREMQISTVSFTVRYRIYVFIKHNTKIRSGLEVWLSFWSSQVNATGESSLFSGWIAVSKECHKWWKRFYWLVGKCGAWLLMVLSMKMDKSDSKISLRVYIIVYYQVFTKLITIYLDILCI